MTTQKQPGEMQGNNGETPPLSFDQLYTGLDDAGKRAIDGHISGLKSALDRERESAKVARSEVTTLTKKVQESSAAQQRVAELERKTAIMEQLYRIGVTNSQLAYMAVTTSQDLLDDKGVLDEQKFSKQFPELLKKGGGLAFAGQSARQSDTGTVAGMDSWIRQKAKGR